MEIILNFVPPSTNTAYRIIKLGKFHSLKMTQRGKEFKSDVIEILKKLKYKKLNGEIILDIEMRFRGKRKRDIDNYLKLLIDSLKGILFDDDDQIYIINIRKYINQDENQTILRINEK